MTFVLQTIDQVDVNIYHALSRFAGNWLLDHFTSYEESANLFKGGLFVALYWYFWFRKGPDQEGHRRAIITIIIGSLLALFVARVIADLAPFRMRPMYNTGFGHRPYSLPLSLNLEDWSAFPSDTATYFFALSYGLSYLSRRFTLPILSYTFGWICLPRIYLGVHYTSDIVVGAAIGLTTTWLLLRTDWILS